MPTEKQQMLHQIYTRLCFHAGLSVERYHHKREAFIRALIIYPDDLICAAYHSLSHQFAPMHAPSADDFIAFMAPEFHRRQQAACMEAV